MNPIPVPDPAGSGFGAPGFDPAGFDPGSGPTVRDLDQDLVLFLAAKLGITPSPFMVAPGPTAPSITYTLIAEVPVTRLAGHAGLAQRIYQVDFRATHPAVPAQLSESLRSSIQGFRGSFGTNVVRLATYRRVPNGFDQAVNGGASGTYRVAAELSIWFLQSLPAT